MLAWHRNICPRVCHSQASCWVVGGCPTSIHIAAVKPNHCSGSSILHWRSDCCTFVFPVKGCCAEDAPFSLGRMKRAQFGPHDWLSLPVPAGSSWLLVDTLEPETAYQFSVLAQNKLGTSSFSEVVTVNTLGRFSVGIRREKEFRRSLRRCCPLLWSVCPFCCWWR